MATAQQTIADPIDIVRVGMAGQLPTAAADPAELCCGGKPDGVRPVGSVPHADLIDAR